MKPELRPNNPLFSSGPTTKRPGWSLAALENACLGRSHRSGAGKAKLVEVIETSREVLGIPADYKIGIMAGSDTGAVEAAMWSLLGPRGVDVFGWEAFGKDWITDCSKQLPLDDCRTFAGEYGQLPDFSQADTKNRDTIFTWNGTAAGVRVPNSDWIADDRDGLTICDATSAAFAMDLPWDKLDVITWSWQKVLGGEAAHGMLVLSPRAVARLESHTPAWPVPKIFRMTKGGKLNEGIFKGATINTPSMLAVEDALDAMNWVKENGGVETMIARAEESTGYIHEWIANSDWADHLAEDPATRTTTGVCVKIKADWFTAKEADEQEAIIKKLCGLLEDENVAYDINAYRDAPAGLRIWVGGTVEPSDVKTLLPWIDWAWNEIKEA